MLKILQARLQRYMNQELPDVQDGFRESRGTRDQIANTCWIIEKQGNSRKTSTSVSLTTLKPLTVWITQTAETSQMRVPDHIICLLRKLYVGQKETEPDKEQWIGSKLGKVYIKAVYCNPVYLTSCRVQFNSVSSVTQSCPTLCNPMNHRVHHVKCQAG